MERTAITKSQYWQMVRGVCLLAVIMAHCPTGQNYTDIDYVAWVLLRHVINFPVAMFVFLAGYFMTPEKTQCGYRTFLFKRGKRLLLSYLVWSCIYLLKTAVFDGTTLRQVVYALLCGKAAAPLYYIIVMIQLTIITPWLVKHRKKWMYLVTPVYLVFLYAYNIKNRTAPPLYETLFPAWFFFYLLGMDCRSADIRNWLGKIKGHWVIAALLLSLGEAAVLKAAGCTDGFVTSQFKFGNFMYAAAFALWLLKKKSERGRNILSMAGNFSYGIFYCHVLVLWGACKAVELARLDHIWVLNAGLCFVLTVTGSFLLVWIARKLAGKWKCENVLPVLGF